MASQPIIVEHISEMDAKRQSEEEAALKRVAFFSVSFATVAILATIVTVPMMYNYMQVII